MTDYHKSLPDDYQRYARLEHTLVTFTQVAGTLVVAEEWVPDTSGAETLASEAIAAGLHPEKIRLYKPAEPGEKPQNKTSILPDGTYAICLNGSGRLREQLRQQLERITDEDVLLRRKLRNIIDWMESKF